MSQYRIVHLTDAVHCVLHEFRADSVAEAVLLMASVQRRRLEHLKRPYNTALMEFENGKWIVKEEFTVTADE